MASRSRLRLRRLSHPFCAASDRSRFGAGLGLGLGRRLGAGLGLGLGLGGGLGLGAGLGLGLGAGLGLGLALPFVGAFFGRDLPGARALTALTALSDPFRARLAVVRRLRRLAGICRRCATVQ